MFLLIIVANHSVTCVIVILNLTWKFFKISKIVPKSRPNLFKNLKNSNKLELYVDFFFLGFIIKIVAGRALKPSSSTQAKKYPKFGQKQPVSIIKPKEIE